MTFLSRKDLLFKTTILLVCIILSIPLYYSITAPEQNTETIISIIVTLITAVFISWVFFGTHYTLNKTHLIYACGPFKGRIALDNITEIHVNKTLWVGLKPATATKGLIIKHNKYDEIYISPKTNDIFVKQILKHKSTIKII